ncbi:hypothetical protein EK21DRAFT_108307 [Setomelanomma holmii]|uniref:Uncharacterized protein n=1 Tax=Setomelanomma holmii TaxID=210430 RepID=A0A9P4HFZ3_9PLEO|nr:hypothetical protein EK21DRAFT_108307 [Setomelanomma holmii]
MNMQRLASVPIWAQFCSPGPAISAIPAQREVGRQQNRGPHRVDMSTVAHDRSRPGTAYVFASIDARQYHQHDQDSSIVKEELQRYGKKVDAMNAQSQALAIEKAHLRSQIATLTANVADKDKKLERMRAKSANTNSKHDDADTELNDLPFKSAQKDTRIAKLEEDLKQANEGWRYYHQKSEAARTDRDILRSECESLRSSMHASEAEMKSKDKQIAKLQASNQSWKGSYDQWMKKLTGEAADMQGQIESLQPEREALFSTMDKRKEQIARLERKSGKVIGEARKWKRKWKEAWASHNRDSDATDENLNIPENILSQTNL